MKQQEYQLRMEQLVAQLASTHILSKQRAIVAENIVKLYKLYNSETKHP
jgi:hypothetical protein